jgi:hypothetical protein
METTLNIRIELLEKITSTAQERNISRSELIIDLLQKVMADESSRVRMGKLVKYQEKRKAKEWHRFHVCFREDDYEYFLDLRKLMKMSLSFILAYAVKKYLDELAQVKKTDNYRYTNYLIIKDWIGSVVCWRLVWGYPPEIAKYLEPETIKTR